ncbi:MAG: chemotaxis protein CheX [candidate division Zixibacteria bacterium]|nr:chemotaxis protein CheX [candidate division Zixibacteria bacterium]MDH3936966.1 chemotaxis protein CheX [candidate division Zixibacteria bacterium]MDH4035015.1 chemotaxis protein CheX [candidate division Zixibacteria bacterium]
MKKLVYIGENLERADQLRRILSDEYRFEAIERSQAFDLDDCALVIIEKRSDPGSHKRNMVRFKSLVGYRDIPIVISLDQTDLDRQHTPIDHSCTMLISPFDDDQVRRQIQRALTKVGVESSPDEDILQVIAQATRLVVGQIAGVEIVQTGNYARKEYHLSGEVCALMPLSGHLQGCLAVGLSTLLARRLSAQMACCDEGAVSDRDLPDGVGEIINQISGKVKTIMSEQDKSVEISLPEVCRVATGRIAENDTLPVQVLLFECGREAFAVYVCLRQCADNPAMTGAGLSTY